MVTFFTVLFENKEKFVTKAYEEKLKDNKKELIRQRIEDNYDEKNKVNEEVFILIKFS